MAYSMTTIKIYALPVLVSAIFIAIVSISSFFLRVSGISEFSIDILVIPIFEESYKLLVILYFLRYGLLSVAVFAILEVFSKIAEEYLVYGNVDVVSAFSTMLAFLFHICTAIIYLKCIDRSKKHLIAAFSVNVSLHAVYNFVTYQDISHGTLILLCSIIAFTPLFVVYILKLR